MGAAIAAEPIYSAKVMSSKNRIMGTDQGMVNERIFNKLKGEAKKMNVKVTSNAHSLTGSHYDINNRSINLINKRTDIIAHELGHAKTFNSKNVGTKILAGLSKGSRVATMLGLGLAPSIMALGDPDSKGSKAAPYVAAATQVPILADEAKATISGFKDLKRLGATEIELSKARKAMGKAFGTYGLAAISAIAAPILIRELRK